MFFFELASYNYGIEAVSDVITGIVNSRGSWITLVCGIGSNVFFSLQILLFNHLKSTLKKGSLDSPFNHTLPVKE